jgi:hypothetical protein
MLLTDKASIRTILNPGCLAAKDTQDTALPDLSAQVYIDPDREHRTYRLSASRGLLAIDSQEGYSGVRCARSAGSVECTAWHSCQPFLGEYR